jgi:hypothetical protein
MAGMITPYDSSSVCHKRRVGRAKITGLLGLPAQIKGIGLDWHWSRARIAYTK